MATPTGGKMTDANGSGLTGRALAAIQTWAFGWFGPGVPIDPSAPREDVVGRRMDYAVTENLNWTPKSEPTETRIGFPVLRRIAEPADGGLDLLRLAIETRKDQMAAQKWTIRGVAKDDDGGDRAKAIEALIRDPDNEHTYAEWSRMLLEDHLVIDSVCIYPRQASDRVLLEVMDAATIKQYIDLQGRRPLPPFPAYSQILHGVVADDYTSDELLYFKYNARTNRLYGQSRVEQIANIVNLALRRQLHVLQYYTEGNVPEALVGVPETWNPSQIKDFQTYWDAILAGNTAERRHMKFVPGGTTTVFTKEDALKNEFDEWLARIICYAFSLSPETLVKQTNRATAETAKEAAAEEGLEPLKLWWSSLMNRIIARVFKAPDLIFEWQDEEITDPKTKAEVTQILAGGPGKPIFDLDELRKLWGQDPATPEQVDELRPAPVAPSPMLGGFGAPHPVAPKAPAAIGAGDPPAGDSPMSTKVGKAGDAGGRSLRNAPRDEAHFGKVEKRIYRAANKALKTLRDAAVKALRSQKVAKLSDDEVAAILAQLPADAWTDQLRELLAALEDMASERAAQAFDALAEYLGESPDDIATMLAQVNVDAVSWAQDRGGELVTEVEDSTRAAIGDLISSGLEDGLTNDEIADQLSDSFLFSPERATLIARTETAFAENAGTLIGWRGTGVVETKIWLVADADVCPECEALDGEEVPLEAPFSSGDDAPPLHPNCRCTMTAGIAHDYDLEAIGAGDAAVDE